MSEMGPRARWRANVPHPVHLTWTCSDLSRNALGDVTFDKVHLSE